MKSESQLRKIYKKLKNAYDKWRKENSNEALFFCLDCQKRIYVSSNSDHPNHKVLIEQPYCLEEISSWLDCLKWVLEEEDEKNQQD